MESIIISSLEPMLNVKQAAAYLQVSPGTIYNWIYQKRLTTHRIGNGPRAKIRFKIADLDSAMRKIKATQPLSAKPMKEVHHGVQNA